MFIYKTAKSTPVWTTSLKIRAIFAHQTLTEHALLPRRGGGGGGGGVLPKFFLLFGELGWTLPQIFPPKLM